jgi:hypothetical protein
MAKVYVPRTKLKISYSIEGTTSEYTLEQIRWLIQRALNTALEDTIIEIEAWILKYVPKRSGDLQKSLLSFLEKSVPPEISMDQFHDLRLVLGAGREVDYIKYVDQMTNAQVQHFGTWLEHSGRRAYSKGKPVFLNDPQALGQFFDQMVTYGKERFLTNLNKAKYKLERDVIKL